MERRVLLAIFLAFLVLYVWQALFVKPVPKPGQPPARSAATSAQPPAQTPSSAAAPQLPAEAPSVEAAPAAPPAATLVGETSEHETRVETQSVIAVFTNRGARLKSWRLKRYLDHQGQPQELVETKAQGQPLPFSLRTADPKITATLNDALYVVSNAPTGVISTPIDLHFEYRNAAGVRAVKEFHFDPDGYVVNVRASIGDGDRSTAPIIQWGPAIGVVAEATRGSQSAEGIVYQDKVRRLAQKDIAKQSEYAGDFKLAGVDDNYFLTGALFQTNTKVRYQPVAIPPAAGSTDAARQLVAYEIEPAAANAPIRFFVGPKDFDVLQSISPDLTNAINFGMFAVIVAPLLRSLKWVNGYVGNWGFSIIILTIFINVIMFPLRHKSVVSMRKMQEIQPEVKAIQDRYSKLKATDPAKQKMNQELMTLYRERGVNPAGGCVPMLLTMPVLIAMWSLLSTAIELRGAPFIGWIHDLTAHDPLYITPVIMGASQLWQQKMTPNTGMDPAQQRMMMMMPIIFTVMFLWLPAGVAIYYAVTNIWAIGQQYLTNYLIGPPKVRTVRPPAERRVKKAPGKGDAAAES
jgi:YidC/Oxa1 family membrane protein insertase